MELIYVDSSNIDEEHICCVRKDKKGENCIPSKKEWMREEFKNGLKFIKVNVSGKVFIEFVPAENAWSPVEAPGFMHINCFWVSGQYKGKGYGKALLDQCIHEAKAQGRKGVVVLSSKKKIPFLSDPVYLKKKGFKTIDTAYPYYELLYLPFAKNEVVPRFKEICKEGTIGEEGYVLYYSNQCPYAKKYGKLIEKIAKEQGFSFTMLEFSTKEEAQNAPSPFTTYSLFYKGKFITNEILSQSKFLKLLEEKTQI